nr:GGDEF domain-containing protein [Lachnospiraceae bacterium]
DIQNGDKDVYFIEKTKWGTDYTLARPLIDSNGVHYGVLCVDISLDELQNTLNKSFYINIGLIILLGAAFMAILLFWMRRHVVIPIKALENSVSEYADSSSGKSRPEELVFVPPDIRVDNEIKVLSESVFKMSVNMIDYVRNNVISEKKVEGLKGYVNKINDVAYCDPLTHVKNRAAYEEKRESLESDIFNRVAQFAIVMADVNFLKKINDKFGHDKGNEYIIGSCGILADIYKRSPIFRVGGDEFVVILEGKDYRNRDELIKIAIHEFEKTSADKGADPWHRYSAAIGMAAYVPGEDEDVETVFKRADDEMYAAKTRMKATR